MERFVEGGGVCCSWLRDGGGLPVVLKCDKRFLEC